LQPQNPTINQNNGQFRQLTKTASSPKLLQSNQEEAFETEPKKK
jgi:hypothetical protein